MSETIALKKITEDTLVPILKLKVAENQKNFVADNAVSIAQAHFSKTAWFRGIYRDDEPVGFVMLDINPEENDFYLWRFMIAEPFQGKGYGKKALELVLDHVRTIPEAREFLTSYVPGEGCPGPFYIKNGFEETGDWDDGEKVLKFTL